MDLKCLNIFNLLVFLLTNSRAPFVSFVMMDLVYIFAEDVKKYFAKAVTFFFCFFAFFSFFLSKVLIDFFPALDTFSSGRLTVYAKVINNMELKHILLGGAPIGIANFYLRFTSIHGLLLLIMLFIFVIKQIFVFIDKDMVRETAFVTAFLLYGMFENVLSSFDSMAAIVFWTYILGMSLEMGTLKKT